MKLAPRTIWHRLVLRRRRQILAEHQWEELVQRSESLAHTQRRAQQRAQQRTQELSYGGEGGGDLEFEQLVADALDRLPGEFQRVLADVPVVVSERGEEHHAYGLYMGDTAARDSYTDRIVIFRDTLERDFGHDRSLLAAQVERTVRHEVAHHLGWDEPGVRDLGL